MNDERAFVEQVSARAARKLAAQHDATKGVWSGLGMIGMVGWSVALPTLVGAACGVWLDKHYSGRHPWTLALLVAGLVLGCLNAWHWVAKEAQAMNAADGHPND